MRTIPALLPALVLFSCSASTTPTEEVDGTAARIDSYLLAATEAGFAGSVLVVRDGSTVLDKGYGLRDREQGLPNGPGTVHAIGSITKQFTAACILKLQEQGRLKVTDAIAAHLPDVPADKAAITLHQLLTHSAGFPGAIGDDDEPVDAYAFLRLAMAAPLEFAPGTGYAYSNVGYSLLGIIVERVSGLPYERYLHEQLLVPAGLAHTGYRMPDWSKAELAIGYRKDGSRWGTMLDHRTVAADGVPGWHLRANGGLLSTTHDMHAWLEALHANTVLGAESTQAYFTPHVREGRDAISHYGYGWAIFNTPRGTRLVTHNGGNGVQFADVLWYADEGAAVVLMSNANQRGMQDMAWEIGRTLFDSTYTPGLPEPPVKLDGVPDGPVGDRMRALSDVIGATGSEAELKEWFTAHLGQGFLSDFPMEQHLEVFGRLRADIGPNHISAVEQLGPEEFTMQLVSDKDRSRWSVMLQLRPSDARIVGLGIDAVP